MNLDALFQNEITKEVYSDLRRRTAKEHVIQVKQLDQPTDRNDNISIPPLRLLTLDKFADTLRNHCPDDYGNVSELLTGNAMLAFSRALREFIYNTKPKDNVKNNNILSGLLLYNGEPMKIADIKNIFGEGEEEQFDNAADIYDEIVQYFLWSYCFFLRSNYTVIGYIQLYNLTLQQLILKGQQENEILFTTQRAEALEQLKQSMTEQSMTEQSTEVQQPSKDSKPKQKTKRPAK
jgi:hypothetical protein